ncbi:putative membrane protein YkoI [Methanomicrobium sp. W14]|uniref:YcdB/YcdC domain-containing protein n=1 Tax=Methanomicrobium sp. W14 TaxID=2817839 RepID=UPI001AEA8D20|nr:hypothetical protein [Methanomicrobium sp. W14]MBP2134528.1 putative membrane protein YkoI [Methanomicrobium sp. W14]
MLFCISSGCTSQTDVGTNVVTTATTALPVESVVGSENTLTETVSPEKSTGESKSLSEIFDGYSDYILELFPDFIPETVKGKIPWEGTDSRIPVHTVYTYDHIKTASSANTQYEVEINAETGIIRSASETTGYTEPEGKIRLSLNDGESIAKDFITKALGDDPDNLFSSDVSSRYSGNQTELMQEGRAAEIMVEYTITHDGLPCDAGMFVTINSISGNVTSCYFIIPDIQNLTFSSKSPSITFDEAKEIVESKINEKYPGEIKNLDITSEYEDSGAAIPSWDTGISVYYDSSTPVRLVWDLNIITKSDYAKPGDDLFYSTGAVVDAHTGEIRSLYYKDIMVDSDSRYYNQG